MGTASQDSVDQSASAKESRSAWARLLAKIYEVDLIGGSCLRSKQREPLALYPLWFPDAGPGRHQRSPAGQENPSPSHQDRSGPTGAVRRFLGLNLLSCFLLLRGSLRPLSQCPVPFDAHGHRFAPISCMPAHPARSPFTHFRTFLAHNPLRSHFKRFVSGRIKPPAI